MPNTTKPLSIKIYTFATLQSWFSFVCETLVPIFGFVRDVPFVSWPFAHHLRERRFLPSFVQKYYKRNQTIVYCQSHYSVERIICGMIGKQTQHTLCRHTTTTWWWWWRGMCAGWQTAFGIHIHASSLEENKLDVRWRVYDMMMTHEESLSPQTKNSRFLFCVVPLTSTGKSIFIFMVLCSLLFHYKILFSLQWVPI